MNSSVSAAAWPLLIVDSRNRSDTVFISSQNMSTTSSTLSSSSRTTVMAMSLTCAGRPDRFSTPTGPLIASITAFSSRTFFCFFVNGASAASAPSGSGCWVLSAGS